MGSEPDVVPSSTPKLSLYSLPSKPPPPPGSLTPPLHTVASIPFQWEEAPGKPRPVSLATSNYKSRAARCLDLPPRLLTERSRVTNIASPTTVLEGPYEGGRSVSFSLGSGEEKGRSSRELRWFRGSFKDSRGASVGSFDFSSSYGLEDDSKVKMTRIRRRSSFLSFSNSSLVGSIYGSLKQAVPWRRRN